MDESNNINQEEQELFEHYKFIVDKGQGALRIDKYLSDKLAGISRSKIRAAADAGNIVVNKKAVKANYKVKPDDEISILMEYPRKEIEMIAEDIPLDIMYEDDDILIVNKKPGMVVHPSFGHSSGTLVNALMGHLKKLEMFSGDDPRPGLVHRIDKNTSGILVIAKTEMAMNKLAKQFFDHSIERKYIALVWGSFDQEEGTITGNIGRNPKNRKVMYVFPEGEYGKHAVTHYRVLEHLGYVSLLELQLETGRTHQIRAHMSYIGHPLFNDADYGGDQILKGTTFTKYKQYILNCFKILPRQALHAKSLGFIHPRTGEKVFFDSKLPDDMQDTIDKWRAYVRNRKDIES